MTRSYTNILIPFIALSALVCHAHNPVTSLLQSHLDQAQATEFKKIHASKSQWRLPHELYYAPQTSAAQAQRAELVATHRLRHASTWKQHNEKFLAQAQELRKKLTQEHATLKDGTLHKKSALKGALQMYGGVCGVLSAGLALSIFITRLLCYRHYHAKSDKEKKWRQMGKVNNFTRAFRNKLHASKIFYPGLITYRFIEEESGGGYLPGIDDLTICGTILKFVASFGLSAFLTYWCTTAGYRNITIALDYKKHLETQIKNIDEIIEYLENNTSAHAATNQIGGSL